MGSPPPPVSLSQDVLVPQLPGPAAVDTVVNPVICTPGRSSSSSPGRNYSTCNVTVTVTRHHQLHHRIAQASQQPGPIQLSPTCTSLLPVEAFHAVLRALAEQHGSWEMKGRMPGDLVLMILTVCSICSIYLMTASASVHTTGFFFLVPHVWSSYTRRPSEPQLQLPRLTTSSRYQSVCPHTVPTKGSDCLCPGWPHSLLCKSRLPIIWQEGHRMERPKMSGSHPANAALVPLIRTRISIELGVICRSRTIGRLLVCWQM